MKMLVKALGGSTAYGLNTPESDLDYRGVFINTDSSKILGLERMDHIQKQETDDIVYYEIRKFLSFFAMAIRVLLKYYSLTTCLKQVIYLKKYKQTS